MLKLRKATIQDAELLSDWYGNPELMKHVGFKHGLHVTIETLQERIKRYNDEDCLLIIEYVEKPIGELHYRIEGLTASVGIKICDLSSQGQGFGKESMRLLIDLLFDKGIETISLDPLVENTRAIRLYESLGFRTIKVHENCWTDPEGNLRSAVIMKLERDDYVR